MIPFNKPHFVGTEVVNVAQVQRQGQLSGDGPFTRQCHNWLERRTGARRALLTHSCTAALEMAAILAEIGPGDEAIMPSYTFVSTANAVALRGGTPVFVDIRPDTLNLDETLLEAAITPRTRAIVPVHYAGVACEMDTILAIARRHGLLVIEDAAQGVLATYKGRPLGAIGDMGAMSFHETKNVISGEGGALIVANPHYADRAEIIREKGTNRRQFLRGQVDKYTWVDIGSSYLPSELVAAFLAAQLDAAEAITARRLAIWDRYHQAFAAAEREGRVRRPIVPADCGFNAHMYYLLLNDIEDRTAFIETMKAAGIGTAFHYVPLHSAPKGAAIGRAQGALPVTSDLASRLVRLPLWPGLEEAQDRVIETALDVLSGRLGKPGPDFAVAV